ncbi:hypothetical protein UB38_08585 [Photobacterium iliopiscarium]|nr:hypothetical protein UB38_08585 [Photobacterium iliopiscarium]
MINFFPVNADEINQDKVELCGSTAMLAAINKNSDVTLIDIRLNIKEGKRIEFITVDICNDEIPSRNVIGINYRERICFVFIEEESLPLTLALRQDFPITMHQNAPSEDSAKSLCLYLEPSDVVEASWTAEKHIKRTNWWLKKTAIEKLHHNDQGVEQLFYNPSLTIVLPFDFDFKSNFGRQLNVISRDRNDTKDGFFIVTDWDENRSLNNSLHLNIVTIKTKPIVHGVINLNVNTLSSLTKLFHSLDVDIVNLIRLQLLDIINTNKCNLYIDFTVFILTLPIKRSSDSEVENTQTVALFSNKSLAELVVLFEVPCQSLNKFRLNFIGGLFPFSCNDIDLSIEFMECLKESCKKSRQLQSGTYKPFGSGAIIGAGSLGGALADLWVKSGWGTWTIIDNDLFRPHNFTRHVISPSFFREK